MSEQEWDHPVFKTREEFDQRVEDVIAVEQEHAEGEQWWYLSFATDEEFLGGLYIQAVAPFHATMRAHELGLNPGGQVALQGPLSAEAMDEYVPVENRNRLLSKEEVES